MNYNQIIYDEGDKLEHLNTPNFSNIYLVISGMIHFQKVKSNFIFHRGDVFVVYDFEENLIIHREGMLACISVNNLSYHRFTLINQENLLEKYKLSKLITETYITTLKNILENNSFNGDIGVIKLINYLNLSQANIYGQLTYSNKLIKNVVEYINQHYKQPLTLNLIAKNFYVNSSYLSREFSKKMNISLIKYIKKVKIYSLSRELLTNGNSESIWVDYGFRSYNTYLRDFKNVMQMTPKDFIKQHYSKSTNTKIEPHQLYNQLQLILDTIKSE
ncbi:MULTISPECIES: helix-turn-helix domain-containing protein [unclassified Staphylococcus]|uniref:AraC family transcriptional regulator n=1 Tax=Staphylococcus TaxID=1279 RepID=UPI001AEBD97C|nr:MULTISPECIES: helix-turn-helix domain-containing protein [unclassified Staphylococcus]